MDLRGMRRTEQRLDRLFSPEQFNSEPNEDYTVVDEVSLRSNLNRDGDKYRLVGRIESCLRLSCSRCIKAFDLCVNVSVDLMYLPYGVNIGDGEAEISDEDLAIAFYRDDQIDMGIMIREQLQLTVPMKPLCCDDCQGLCPVCGKNLNHERCSCDPSWHDPRLDVLAALRSDSRKD